MFNLAIIWKNPSSFLRRRRSQSTEGVVDFLNDDIDGDYKCFITNIGFLGVSI